MLDELAKLDLEPNKGKFHTYLVHADPSTKSYPTWLKRPFVITCPITRARVTEAIAEASDAKSAADRAGPGEKAAAEITAQAAAQKAEGAT